MGGGKKGDDKLQTSMEQRVQQLINLYANISVWIISQSFMHLLQLTFNKKAAPAALKHWMD